MFMRTDTEDDQLNPYQPSPRSRSPFGPHGEFPPTFLDRLANTVWRLVSHVLIFFAWKIEALYAYAYGLLCLTFGIKSLPALSSDRTAICVMGSDDGVGRMVALKFAEAGYTVFGCLPHDVHTPRGTGYSSAISPLLYIWQAKKARARTADSGGHVTSLLGSIVPLVFDPSIPDDCERAVETIRAYCDRHNLQLSAIILPPLLPPSHSSSSGYYESGSVAGSSKSYLPYIPGLMTTSQGTLHDAVASTIAQPLSMIQALLSTLRDAKGRIIFLSGETQTFSLGSDGGPLMSLCDAARKSTAATLASELRPFDIHVSLIAANTSTPTSSAMPAVPINPYSQDYESDTERPQYGHMGVVSLGGLIRALLSTWKINDESYFRLIRGVLESRYPRSTHRFGLDVIIYQLVTAASPDGVTFVAKHIIHSIFGSARLG